MGANHQGSRSCASEEDICGRNERPGAEFLLSRVHRVRHNPIPLGRRLLEGSNQARSEKEQESWASCRAVLDCVWIECDDMELSLPPCCRGLLCRTICGLIGLANHAFIRTASGGRRPKAHALLDNERPVSLLRESSSRTFLRRKR